MKKAARENATGVPVPVMRGSRQMGAVDDAVAASEEVQEQFERKRLGKKAFENRISEPSADKSIGNGRIRG